MVALVPVVCAKLRVIAKLDEPQGIGKVVGFAWNLVPPEEGRRRSCTATIFPFRLAGQSEPMFPQKTGNLAGIHVGDLSVPCKETVDGVSSFILGVL